MGYEKRIQLNFSVVREHDEKEGGTWVTVTTSKGIFEFFQKLGSIAYEYIRVKPRDGVTVTPVHWEEARQEGQGNR